MIYVPVDDKLPEHPKTLLLPRKDRDAALGMLMRCWCYCSRAQTDGFVPDGFFCDKEERRLRDLLAKDNGQGVFFDVVENGIIVHDWLDYNRSRDEIKQRKEVKREAGRRGGVKSGRSRSKANSEAESKQVLDVCLPSGSSKGASKTNPSTTTTTIEDTESVSSTAHTQHLLRFDEAWDAYPIHTYRDQAAAAWGELIASGTDPDSIIEACGSVPRKHQQSLSFFLSDGTWRDFIPKPKVKTEPCSNPECCNGWVIGADDVAERCPVCWVAS